MKVSHLVVTLQCYGGVRTCSIDELYFRTITADWCISVSHFRSMTITTVASGLVGASSNEFPPSTRKGNSIHQSHNHISIRRGHQERYIQRRHVRRGKNRFSPAHSNCCCVQKALYHRYTHTPYSLTSTKTARSHSQSVNFSSL